LPAHDKAYWLVSYPRHIVFGASQKAVAYVTLPVEILGDRVFVLSRNSLRILLQAGPGLQNPLLRSLILNHEDFNPPERISQWKVGLSREIFVKITIMRCSMDASRKK
jgi:hypothetical protein